MFCLDSYFRYYLGRTPVIVVADPDMLRQLLVKDFSNFPNRNVRKLYKAKMQHVCLFLIVTQELLRGYYRLFCLCSLISLQKFVFAKKPVSDCLLQLRNEQWKRVRSVLTPSFSAAKMKEVRK